MVTAWDAQLASLSCQADRLGDLFCANQPLGVSFSLCCSLPFFFHYHNPHTKNKSLLRHQEIGISDKILLECDAVSDAAKNDSTFFLLLSFQNQLVTKQRQATEDQMKKNYWTRGIQNRPSVNFFTINGYL